MEEDDKFCVNGKFTNPHKRVKINQIQLKETVSVSIHALPFPPAHARTVHSRPPSSPAASSNSASLFLLLSSYSVSGEGAGRVPREGVQRPAVPSRRRNRAHHEGAEDAESHDAHVGALWPAQIPVQGECV